MNDDFDGKTNPASGMLAQGVICVVGGVTVLGVGAANVFGNMDGLAELTPMWDAGGSSLNSLSVTMLYVAIGMGAMVMLAGLVGLGSYVRKNRMGAAIALGVVVVCTIIQLAGGALFFTLINRSFDILEPSSTEGATYTDDEAALLETSHAVFNECCQAVWGSSIDPLLTASTAGGELSARNLLNDFQQDIRSCTVSPVDLPAVIDGLVDVPSIGARIEGVLLTCFNDAKYTPIANYLQTNVAACGALSKINPAFGADLEIPTTTLKLNAFLITAGLIPDGYVISDWAMTGFPGFEDSDGVEGFNCGLMYAKGITWIQHLYLNEVGFTTCIVIFAAGSLQLASALVTVILWYMAGNETKDAWMDYDGKANQASPYNTAL